uniref:Large ribosomal subunit protein bL35m n=1 Tax=Daphnia dolichocephala TaxID=2282166 RepID=A0A4Y7M654_9CRUS|nr:EOG090X0J5E [Daphnia dolichocephala]
MESAALQNLGNASFIIFCIINLINNCKLHQLKVATRHVVIWQTTKVSEVCWNCCNIRISFPCIQQTRSVTKWSLNKGKRKTVKAVVGRFYRLGWGAWIRPMVGHSKRHWSKTAKRKIRSEKHVFCNSTQSTLLDKMVTKYWRKRRFYIDDVYEPYQQREEYSSSAVKPH